MVAGERGLYGFRLVLPSWEGELPDLGRLEPDSPAVEVERRHACMLADRWESGEQLVSLGWEQGAAFEVRRQPPSISIDTPEPPTPESLVHPVLTPPMSILTRWRGDLALHAGGFHHRDSAWAVIGAKGAGKSTMLAAIGQRGLPLLADDLLALDGDVVRAGPSCVDLRPDVAERFPEARFLGQIGERPRHRLSAPGGPARSRLAGIFVLDWSDDGAVHAERVPLGESVRLLYESEHMEVQGPGDASRILDLVEKPMWRIRRPREWSFTDEVLDRLLETAVQPAG